MMSTYVLVVDDEPDAREILAHIVASVGLDTQTACDGEDALRLARTEPPSLVLLDLMMPRMDGFGCYAGLRAVPATRNIPVIVVSALASYQLETARLPGVFAVVQKKSFKDLDGLRTLVAEAVGVDLPESQRPADAHN